MKKGKKKYKCSKCGLEYFSKAGLDYHKERMHSGKKLPKYLR